MSTGQKKNLLERILIIAFHVNVGLLIIIKER